jgi:phenylpropionate dioxygenase-like ring-hydroxylating dioxygenase large terminal subunit
MMQTAANGRVPDWPSQALRGHTIPGDRYTSPDFYAREWEQMWTKVWLLLGREDEMSEPGDWQREDVGRESFLLVRQTDGEIRAFYNVCQHRGNLLVDEEKGSAQRFVCRYHAWAWKPDGSLTYVPDVDDFPDGNPCEHLKLEEVRCERFAGFVWINMDPDCGSLRDYLGPVWDEWAAYEFEKWKRYLARTTTVPCNWKVILDNFNESYHVPFVHRVQSREVRTTRFHPGIDTDYRNTRFDMADEGHNRMIMRGGFAGSAIDDEGAIGEPLATLLRDWELDPEEFTGRGQDTRAALQKAKRTVGAKRGYSHYANLTDDQLTDAFHYTLFPNFAVSVWSDGFHFLRARPHPTDPAQCIFHNWWYATQPPGATPPVRTTAGIVDRDAVVEHEVFPLGEKSMGITIDQDLSIVRGQQLGLGSRGYRGAHLAGQEGRVRRYHEVIDDYIEGRRPAAGSPAGQGGQ